MIRLVLIDQLEINMPNIVILQLNLKNCFSFNQFLNYLDKSIQSSHNNIDLITFPENLNLCLLFAKKYNIETKSIKNILENIFDKFLSYLNLNFILNMFDINNQKLIIIEASKQLAIKYNCYISTGSYYHKINGKYYNSFSLIDPQGGVLAEYHKYDLLGIEKAFKIQSVYNPQIIETVIGKLGLCICYDLNDKDYIKKICENGCDILIAPSNGWRLFPGYPFDKIKEKPQVQRSKENNVNILRPYCAGWLLPLLYFQGNSHVTDRNGSTLAESKTRNKTENLFVDIS